MRAKWKARIRTNNPWVAEVDGALAGFADLQANGYIDQFFVAPAHAGQGVGSALMRHLQQVATSQGITRLYAHVSLTAQPFFAHHGFLIEEERLSTICGVGLHNALMSKHLIASAGAHIP